MLNKIVSTLQSNKYYGFYPVVKTTKGNNFLKNQQTFDNFLMRKTNNGLL